MDEKLGYVFSVIMVVILGVILLLLFYNVWNATGQQIVDRDNSCKDICASNSANFIKVSVGSLYSHDVCMCKKYSGEIFSVTM